ncbi:MAG: hypothetical protein WEC34_00195 [Acidimicrobiia bacterium]
MDLAHLDTQLVALRAVCDELQLSELAWAAVATTVHAEVAALDEVALNRLRLEVLIPPERYLSEMGAFQSWMDFAHNNADNPVVVRAQVMTELYVAFVWLRDALMLPLAKEVPSDSVFATAAGFLSSGTRRLLRNAIAHGRWCYLDDFSGLECWAEPSPGAAHARFVVSQDELGGWQMLSRGTSIAALLALASGSA